MAALVAVSAAIASAVAPSGVATAADTEQAIYATVDLVQVNRMGGITVSGSLDCTEQVAAIYGGAANIPLDTMVLVNMNWDALQYVGKNKTVFAEYDSGIASICYTNLDPSLFPDWVDLVAPYSWDTRYAYPVGTVQWVYSRDGKFAAGPIHIELTASGGLSVYEESDPPGNGEWFDYYLYDFSGWNLRATKVR
jgi:hypothetical protein